MKRKDMILVTNLFKYLLKKTAKAFLTLRIVKKLDELAATVSFYFSFYPFFFFFPSFSYLTDN